ncbi:MAG: GWxTD domain-containing protein [Flavobacteriales bacterium]
MAAEYAAPASPLPVLIRPLPQFADFILSAIVDLNAHMSRISALLITLTFLKSTLGFSLNVSFNYGVFMTSDKELYAETYMIFDAETFRFKQNQDSSYQQHVELTYIIEQQGKLINFSKTAIHGPVTSDTNQLSDFIDQQRFVLGPGTYDLYIRIQDINNPTDSVKSVQKLEIRQDPESVFFSSIYLVERSEKAAKESIYTRNGTNYYPRISPFYPPAASEMTFYAELYGTSSKLGSETPFLINIDLIDPETNEPIETFHQSIRSSAKDVQVISKRFNIQSLRTATYFLQLEAKDHENKLLATRHLEVKRFNSDPQIDSVRTVDVSKTFVSKMSDDSLRQMCYCAVHKANQLEEKFILNNWKEGDIETLRTFFYGYWYDRNPLNAQLEWHRYHELIQHVEDEYRTSNAHGCATDRGRIYLKYGKPNSMSIVRNEPHAYPYEIWHYFKIPEKSNAKFFFFDPKRTNDYELAHSNVIGEIRDNLWYTRLVASPGGNRLTTEQQQEALGSDFDNQSAGSRALDYWNNPR